MKLGRLNHVGVATPSIADSIAFYRDVMGATKIHAPFELPAQGVKVCFVDTPNTQIELIEPLGENSPIADLCLTALHAVYVDEFLMPVGELVNGTSITFEAVNGRDTLDFFNIEFDGHDVLDVQGALCESLFRAEMERCAPLLRFTGGRSQLRSRLRSVASIVVDRRQPIDMIRDNLEERGLELARAA